MAQATASPMTVDPPDPCDEPQRLVWSARWSLTTRILAVNIFAIALLAVGFFYLDSYRTRLIDARTAALDSQLSLLAPALEAAGHLRRGRAAITRDMPDALVRLANLLDRSDPDVSAALVHVARRWLHNAMPHVPPEAQESFVARHAVNRLLLREKKGE